MMQKTVASNLAALAMAAALVLPSAYAAQGRSHRNDQVEWSPATINQSIDRADARIATLKADLRLSGDQVGHWPALASALHDVAVKRVKSWADLHAMQTGRASSSSSATSAGQGAEDEEESGARSARSAPKEADARKTKLDDIDKMRLESDALAAKSADLRQIADAAKPLYDSLDEGQRRRLVQFVYNDLRANEVIEPRGRRR